ncbi:hypothetical protein FZC66_07130 [Priestia megaterium]|nr:hypothetical protein FZC66_07130 [Priestia megaterium]
MKSLHTDLVLDAKGLACPMPIVKTKKAMAELQEGQVLEVLATDKGSTADIKAWVQSAGHYYVGTIEEGGVLKHFLRKASTEETQQKKHPHVINNAELERVVEQQKNVMILDVREEAEYAFNHIPGTVSIPLGELERRMNELDKNQEIYVVCRTGSRSDLAAQKLIEKGFKNVTNVVPGMSQWTGKTTAI